MPASPAFPVRVICGLLKKGLPLPSAPPWTSPGFLVDAFRTGSTAGGNTGIDLDVHGQPLEVQQVPAAAKTTTADLQRCLKAMRETVPQIQGRIRVGVVFADRHEADANGREIMGVMFDRGFDSQGETPVAGEYHEFARQGCAVFLGAIRALRGPGAAFDREVDFTTVHELGHVFNLWHWGTTNPTFMSRSPVPAPHPTTAFAFDEEQRRYLTLCPTSAFVKPGGSRYGVRGGLAPDGDGAANAVRGPLPAVELRIAAAQEEFWAFEPVEVDLEVRPRGRVAGPVAVPDELDPGYGRFSLWIEDPEGERRRYRSIQRFCGGSRPIEVTRARPFRRDLAVFGQSGGYTFRASGEHRLWAEFLLRRGQRVVSNVLRLNVLPARLHDRAWVRMYRTLSERENASLLFHRQGRVTGESVAPLRTLAKAHPRRPSAGNVEFAVGRALLRRAHRVRSQPERERLRRLGLDTLRRARDHRGAGPYQARKADAYLRSEA